jgi:hypothetical protein
MLKDLKEQQNKINQCINPEDTRRVEDLMLTDDDCVRSMFSIHRQHCMFPRIEIEATLLRSPE